MQGIWAGSDIAGAIVTSLGFVGAVAAYILNRNKDRQLQLQSEKRAVYKEFFEVTGSYFAALQSVYYSKDPKAEVLQYSKGEYEQVRRTQDSLAYYAPAPVLRHCFAYVDALVIYRGHLNKELNGRNLSPKAKQASSTVAAFKLMQEARRKAITYARSDTINQSITKTEEELASIFSIENDRPAKRIEPLLTASYKGRSKR